MVTRRRRKPGSVGLRLLQFGQKRMETYLPEGGMISRAPAPDAYYQDEYDDYQGYGYQDEGQFEPPPVIPVQQNPRSSSTSDLPVVRPMRESAPPPSQQPPAVQPRRTQQPPVQRPSAPVQRQPSQQPPVQRPTAPVQRQPAQPPVRPSSPPPAESQPTYGTQQRPTPPDLLAILRSHEARQADENAPAEQPPPQQPIQRAPESPNPPRPPASAPSSEQPVVMQSDDRDSPPPIRRRAQIEEITPYQTAKRAEQTGDEPTPFEAVGFDPFEPDENDLEAEYDDPPDIVDESPNVTSPPAQNPPVQASRTPEQPIQRKPEHHATPAPTGDQRVSTPHDEANDNRADSNNRIVQSIIDQAIPPILRTPSSPPEINERVSRAPESAPHIQSDHHVPPVVKDASEPLASKSPNRTPTEQPIRRRPLPRFNNQPEAPDVGELPVEDRLDLLGIDADDDVQTEQVSYDNEEPVRRISNSPFTYFAAPKQLPPEDAPAQHPYRNAQTQADVRPQSDAQPRANTVNRKPSPEQPAPLQRQENSQPEVDSSPYQLPTFEESGAGAVEEESAIVRLRRMAEAYAQRAAEETVARRESQSERAPQRSPEADLLQLLNLPPDTPIAGLHRSSEPPQQQTNAPIQRAPQTVNDADDDYFEDDDQPPLQSVPLDVALMGGSNPPPQTPIQRDPAPQQAQSNQAPASEPEAESDENDLNVDSLARDVLKRLRQRLRIEQERRGKN